MIRTDGTPTLAWSDIDRRERDRELSRAGAGTLPEPAADSDLIDPDLITEDSDPTVGLSLIP